MAWFEIKWKARIEILWNTYNWYSLYCLLSETVTLGSIMLVFYTMFHIEEIWKQYSYNRNGYIIFLRKCVVINYVYFNWWISSKQISVYWCDSFCRLQNALICQLLAFSTFPLLPPFNIFCSLISCVFLLLTLINYSCV